MDEPHFLSDAEIAKRLNLGERTFAIAAKQAGFPPKKRIWGGKRYWPAVRAFVDRANGLSVAASPSMMPDGQEHWDDEAADR